MSASQYCGASRQPRGYRVGHSFAGCSMQVQHVERVCEGLLVMTQGRCQLPAATALLVQHVPRMWVRAWVMS